MNFPQGLEDVVNQCFLPRKQYVWSSGVQVAEGRLVERRCLHNAPRRKLIDDQLDETNLLRRQALVRENADSKFNGPFWVRQVTLCQVEAGWEAGWGP